MEGRDLTDAVSVSVTLGIVSRRNATYAYNLSAQTLECDKVTTKGRTA